MVGPGKSKALSPPALATAIDYIRAHSEIWEVILTGGDPLVLSPKKLGALVETLAAIDHVKVIRIHTRLPVADPKKITPALVRAMRSSPKATYVVLHANHAREMSAEARAACARIVDAGIPMLSQSVLLRGVNDDPRTLADLMRTLVECRVRHGARHAPFPHLDRRGAGADAAVAGERLGPVPTAIRSRHPGRARQGADRAALSRSEGHGRR
jgi:lysine 2,3-aminomutase